MNLFDIFFVLVCGIGALNSLLLSVYYFINKKGDSLLNKLLGLLIFTFSLRVAKVVWIFFFASIHPFYDIIWYFAFISGIILFFLYVFTLTSKSNREYSAALKIFISTEIIYLFAISFFIYEHERLIFYSILTVFAVVLTATALRIFKPHVTNSRVLISWSKTLFLFMTLVFANYFLILFVRFQFLYVEAFLFSFFVYYIAYREIREGLSVKVHKWMKEIDTIDNNVLEQLKELMEVEKVYRDPQLSLPALSKSISVSPHSLSRILNESFGINFNDYINRYRVDEVKYLLTKPENLNIKISAVAFECGFNSISVFNAAFKKFTGKTPSQFLSLIK